MRQHFRKYPQTSDAERLKKLLYMRGQIFAGKIGAETGKAAGQNAAYDKHRRIGKHTESSGKQTGSHKLSGIVGEGTEDTGEHQKPAAQKTVQKPHDKKAQYAAAQTVDEAHGLTGTEGRQKNTHQENEKRFSRCEII